MTTTPKVEFWVEEVEGEKGRKRYRFRCEQVPVPESEKENGLTTQRKTDSGHGSIWTRYPT